VFPRAERSEEDDDSSHIVKPAYTRITYDMIACTYIMMHHVAVASTEDAVADGNHQYNTVYMRTIPDNI